MRPEHRTYLVMFLAVAPLTACARCAPGLVGHGVARLTVRNVGAIAELALTDTRCGFAADAVNLNPRVDGEVGQAGTVTWTVEGCRVEHPADAPYVSDDCNGTTTTIRGRAVITARKVVQGLLTGIPDNPVIPAGPDAVRVEIMSAELEGFSAETSISPNVLTVKSGGLRATLRPRLAVDQEHGACSVPTSNVLFEGVEYFPSVVHVKTESREFDVDVGGSALTAINGVHSGYENAIFGEIEVWGGLEAVDGADEGLDPEYEADFFHAGYQCKPALAQPVNYACEGFLAPVLAQNAARLTIRTIARLTSVLEADTTCGFSSDAVLDSATLSAPVGAFGTATLRVDKCTLDLPPGTVVKEDCVGVQTVMGGRVVISATKAITGRLTGDRLTPAVPVNDAPAEIEVEVHAFSDFSVSEAGAGLRVMQGGLHGKLVPRTAQDATRAGACGFVTGVARMSDVGWAPGTQAQLESSSGAFDLNLGDTRLTAVSGAWGPDENLLDGHIEVNGERFSLPTDPADDGLDPTYDAAAYQRTWQCGTLVMPVSHACAFEAPLAQGTAQLTVQMAGALAGALDADRRCGFSSPGAVSRARVDGELGRRGAAVTYSVDAPCRIDFGARTELSRDCAGVATYASGVVELTGTKVVRGIATGDPENPIVPTTRDPAELRFVARAEGLSVWTGQGAEVLTAQRGRLSGTLAPRTAIDEATGACSIATPVAHFSQVAWQDANLRLTKDGLIFDLRVERSDLEAQNGPGEVWENQLEGSLHMEGKDFAIPAGGDPALNPSYDRDAFMASFACTPGLVVPADDVACDMYQVLGENAARLVALSAGTIASAVNADEECGFEDFFVMVDPDRTEGDEGQDGLLEWSIDGCGLSRGAGAPSGVDCVGVETYWQGGLQVDAKRTVTGLRTSEYWIFDSIVPSDPTSVRIELEQVSLSSFAVWAMEGGEVYPTQGVSIGGGQLSGVVMPITAERRDEPGCFDVPTPVAHMQHLRLRGAPLEIRSGRMTFKLFVDDSDVEAFNGSYAGLGMTNRLGGHIIVDGQRIELDAPLVPGYRQSDFDASYMCDGAVRARIAPE